MKKTVTVTIGIFDKTIKVSNDRGMSWTHQFESNSNRDTSRNAMIASIASAMITATIASHLRHSQADELTYELTVKSE